MNLAIRRLSMTADREEMLALLSRNFGTGQDRRFDWRHLHNPAGPAWSWFAYDTRSFSAVALVTVFPRNMYVDGKAVVAGQVGEFAVDPHYRSLGPAVLLQRTTFEPVNCGALDFCYDCPPHDQGMSTFVRLGMPANTEVFRYAYLLRSDEYIDKRLGHHAWTKPLVTATNLLLSARAAWRRTSKLEIGTYREVFGEEFSALDRSLADSGTIRASRSARDLNWRYRDDPLASTCLPCGTKGRYEVLVARRAGELEAFVVFFIQSDGIASLVDLFGRQVSVTGPALLDAVIQFSRREKVSCIHCCCSDQSELRPVLRDMGFRRRERNSRVVAYTKPNGDAGKRLTAQRWAFSRVEVML